jgi:hypothetical protein
MNNSIEECFPNNNNYLNQNLKILGKIGCALDIGKPSTNAKRRAPELENQESG